MNAREAKNGKALKIDRKQAKSNLAASELDHPRCLICPDASFCDAQHILYKCTRMQSIARTICDPHIHDRIRELQCSLKDCSPEVLRPTVFLHHPNLIAGPMYTAQGFVSQAFIQHNIGILGLTAPQAKTVAELLSLLLVKRSLFIYTLHYKLSKQALRIRTESAQSPPQGGTPVGGSNPAGGWQTLPP
jgi:hypothetical protein